MQPDFAVELLCGLRSNKIHTALETTGFAHPDIFAEAIGKADLLLYDIKHYDSEKHREGTGVDNIIIMRNLRGAIEKNIDVLIRIPVIPGYNDRLADARKFAELIIGIGLTKAQLLPFHLFGQKKYETLGIPYAFGNFKTLKPEDLRNYQHEMKKNRSQLLLLTL